MNLPSDKIHVICGGIDFSGYEQSPLPMNPPVIGFLCRMNQDFGLGIVVDAFIQLKKESVFKETKLYLTGGYSGDDKVFVNQMKTKIENAGFSKDLKIWEEFDKSSRIQFLKSLTLLTVLPVILSVIVRLKCTVVSLKR